MLRLSIKPSKEQYKKLYNELFNFSTHVSFDDFYIQDNGREFLNQYYQLLTAKIGIISLGAEEFSPLMWPHYTAERGFAITFDTEKLEESIQEHFGQIDDGTETEYVGLKKINYVNQLTPLILSESPINNYKISTLILLNIKQLR